MGADPGLDILEGRTPPQRRPPKPDSPQQRAARRINTPTRWALPRVQGDGSHSKLGRLANGFDAAGLDSRAATIRSAIAEADALTPGEPTVDPAAVRRALVLDVAAGKVTAAQAAEQMAAISDTTVAATRAFARDARHAILGRVIADLYEVGDDLAVELDQVVTAATTAITKAAATIDGIGTDDDAIRVGGKPMAAWAAISEARRRIDVCWHLAADLRSMGLTMTLPGTPVPAECWRWRNRAALRTVGHLPRHGQPNHWLIAIIDGGAGPGVLTAAEVVALHLDTSKAPPLDQQAP